MPRIGLLSIGTDPDPAKPNPVWVAFLKGLDERGQVEGRKSSSNDALPVALLDPLMLAT